MPRCRDAPDPTASRSRRRLAFVLFGQDDVALREIECVDDAIPTSAEDGAACSSMYRTSSGPLEQGM